MGLFEEMNRALVSAMKGGRKEEVGIYRMLLSEIKKIAIDRKERDEITDELVTDALTKAMKSRKESVTQYRAGDRDDLAVKEEVEIALIEQYLPEALSETEVAAIVDAAVAEAGAQSPREMGKVMKLVMAQVKGRADGKVIKDLVMERLKG
jgi:uncharacterized protein